MNKFLPHKPEKEIISVRLPLEILKIIDAKAASADISRNELINQMLIFAITNSEDE